MLCGWGALCSLPFCCCLFLGTVRCCAFTFSYFLEDCVVDNLPPCLREVPVVDRLVCLEEHRDCWAKRVGGLMDALRSKGLCEDVLPGLKLFRG